MKHICFFVFVLGFCLNIISCTDLSAGNNSLIISNNESIEIEKTPEDNKFTIANDSWRVAIISDMNGSYGSSIYSNQVHQAMKHISDNDISLVISTGDMVAGQKTGLNYNKMWQAFNEAVTLPLDRVNLPILPSPGNHDASLGNSFKKERELYVNNWQQFPADRFNSFRSDSDKINFVAGVEQNFPLNYAMTMGPSVFVSLDATAVGPLINNQMNWLADVLEKTAQYKIKIIFGHVPLYPFAVGKASEYLALGVSGSGYGARLESLLETYNVTYYFSGHSHVFYPGLRNGRTRYVSVPLLGSGARRVLTKNKTSSLSKQGFLYLNFNSEGDHSLEALESPSYKIIPFNSVPEAVSVPLKSSSDCTSCGSFPQSYFMDNALRTLFLRIPSLQ